MSAGRKGFGALAIVSLLCLLALGYLYQHSCSKRLTREESVLLTRRQHLAESAESLGVEIVGRTTFARLDSVWAAHGRPRPTDGLAESDSAAGVLMMAAEGRAGNR
jgi:hypothetical protein